MVRKKKNTICTSLIYNDFTKRTIYEQTNNLRTNKQFTNKQTIYKMTSMFFNYFSSSEEDSETEQQYKKEDPMILWNEKYGQFITNDKFVFTKSCGIKQKMEICIENFIPFYKLSQNILSWGDYQMDSEETPGTDEYEIYQTNIKQTLKKEKIRKEKEEKERKIQQKKLQELKEKLEKERKRKEKEGLKFADKYYMSLTDVVKERDSICKRNKPFFFQHKAEKNYFTLPQKDQEFFWDLLKYHPKHNTKKELIQEYVYGECVFPKKGGLVSGLLVLQKDGSLDTFSQKKCFENIGRAFKKKQNKNFNNNYQNKEWSYNTNKRFSKRF